MIPTMQRNLHVHVYSRHSSRSFQRDTLDPSPFKQQVTIGIGSEIMAILNVTTNAHQSEAAPLVKKLRGNVDQPFVNLTRNIPCGQLAVTIRTDSSGL